MLLQGRIIFSIRLRNKNRRNEAKDEILVLGKLREKMRWLTHSSKREMLPALEGSGSRLGYQQILVLAVGSL